MSIIKYFSTVVEYGNIQSRTLSTSVSVVLQFTTELTKVNRRQWMMVKCSELYCWKPRKPYTHLEDQRSHSQRANGETESSSITCYQSLQCFADQTSTQVKGLRASNDQPQLHSCPGTKCPTGVDKHSSNISLDTRAVHAAGIHVSWWHFGGSSRSPYINRGYVAPAPRQ